MINAGGGDSVGGKADGTKKEQLGLQISFHFHKKFQQELISI